MAFKQHAYPLRIDVRKSYRLIFVVFIFHFVSAVAIAIVDLPWAIKLCCAVLLTAYLLNSLKSYSQRIFLEWNSDGLWRVKVGDDEAVDAALLGSSVVSRFCIWLHFKSANGKFIGLPLLPDSLSPDVFRRLRVRLQIDGATREQKL